MKTSDKIALFYLIICILIAGFFAILGYGLNGTGSDVPKAFGYFCSYMIWLLTPCAAIFLLIDIIKNFKVYKLIALIVMFLIILDLVREIR